MRDGASGLVTRPVRDRDELEEGLRLVHDNYVRMGYMEPDPSGIRIGVHYALPTARTYIARMGDEVVATLSLFLDSALGIPLDSLYGDFSANQRENGRKIGEVGMLADRRRVLTRGVNVLLQLMRHVFWDCRMEGLDDLLITVNPRHVSFYQKLLCFEQLGPVRIYDSVGCAPAVLLRIGISSVQPGDAPNDRIREVFFSPLSVEDDSQYRMQFSDLPYFFIEKTNLFERLNGFQRRAIEEHFPGLKIDSLLREGMAAHHPQTGG